MNKFFDLNRVPENGTLVLPLSISKLHGKQSPKALYEFLQFFSDKIRCISVDVIIVYTNGLYFNSDDTSLNLRISSTNQMVRHRQEFASLIKERREFTPQAFHFIPWDYLILNSERFSEFLTRLFRAYHTDQGFQQAIANDLSNRGTTEANIRFVLEELVVTHIIRQKYVNLPTTLSNPKGWRLIAYAGPHLSSDLYMHRNHLLPMNSTIDQNDQFSRSIYNYEARHFIDYKRLMAKTNTIEQNTVLRRDA